MTDEDRIGELEDEVSALKDRVKDLEEALTEAVQNKDTLMDDLRDLVRTYGR